MQTLSTFFYLVNTFLVERYIIPVYWTRTLNPQKVNKLAVATQQWNWTRTWGFYFNTFVQIREKCMYHLFTHSLFWQSLWQATSKRCLERPVAGDWSTMDHTGALDAEDELGPLAHLAPSPQSEAVAHELQELSLQSSQHLPPLNERKNGEFFALKM